MAFTQELRLWDGTWVCAGCGIQIAERPEDGALAIDHAAGCKVTGQAMTQRFRFTDGEIVCAGCGAYMEEAAADQTVQISHRADCGEVSGAVPRQA